MRVLPDVSGLIHRICIHHSTVSHSTIGRSMFPAGFILSHAAFRGLVCKRFPPVPDRNARGLAAAGRTVMAGGCVGRLEPVVAMGLGVGASLGVLAGVALDPEADFPDHSGQFAGNGHLDLVVVLEPPAQFDKPGVKAVLRFP